MPFFSIIGFAPAATFLKPSRMIICARIVAVVVTTTATILAQIIIREGFKNVAAGANPMMLKKGIQGAVAVAVEEIKNISKTVESKESIAQVASVSASDDEIGGLIADAMEK